MIEENSPHGALTTTDSAGAGHRPQEHGGNLPSVVIVGGGIVGVSTAYELARRGHQVTLLEEGSIDSGCSTGNAGILALGHPPIPRPGLVAKTVRWMFDRGSPLYVPPRFDLALWRWMWQFRRACDDAAFEQSMDQLARLGPLAGACYDEIVAREEIDCEYGTGGWYELYRTEEGRTEGLHDVELLRDHGFDIELIEGDELREREPAVRKAVLGAAHFRESRILNPRSFLTALADRAAAHGAVIRTNARVIGLHVENGAFRSARLVAGTHIEGDVLVLAAGIWSGGLARSLGINLPMQAGKGYHVMLSKPTPCLTTGCVLAESHVAATPMDGGLRLAGTVEFSGINHDLVERRIDMLVRAARPYLESLGSTQTTARWCGLRPCTSDGLPAIGWAPGVDGVIVATGHAKMGMTLGPATGRLVTELIRDEPTTVDIELLSPARFSEEAGQEAEGIRE